jgi:Tfp pilus assembly protein PilN
MSFLLLHWRKILALGVVLAIVAGVLYVQSIRSTNAELTRRIELSEARLSVLNSALTANQAALKKRTLELTELSKEKATVLAELEKIYEVDQGACDWSASAIPDSVYRQLCQ